MHRYGSLHTTKVLITVLSTVLANAVWADKPWHEHESNYELAREAVERGDALPLIQVQQHLSRVAPGTVVSTLYEFEYERWVYEFKIINSLGHIKKVHIDAYTGELVMISDY